MRAILAPIPQSKGRICSLEYHLLCYGQLAALPFQSRFSPQCTVEMPVGSPPSPPFLP